MYLFLIFIYLRVGKELRYLEHFQEILRREADKELPSLPSAEDSHFESDRLRLSYLLKQKVRD